MGVSKTLKKNKRRINKSKYKNAVLFFVKHCNNKHLGATKLNKLIYYLDFLNYRDRDTSVTGDIYYNQQFGPVPNSILEILNELQTKKALVVKEDPYKENRTRKSYETKIEPDMSVFSEKEKNLLQAICKEFKDYSTDKIIAQTHLEGPWFYSKQQEKIDYEYAYSIEVLSE